MDLAALMRCFAFLVLFVVFAHCDTASAAWQRRCSGEVCTTIPAGQSIDAFCSAVWVSGGWSAQAGNFQQGYTEGAAPVTTYTTEPAFSTQGFSCRGTINSGTTSNGTYGSGNSNWVWCLAGSMWDINSQSCIPKSTCSAFGSQTGSSAVVLNTASAGVLVCIGGCRYAPDVSAKQSDGTWSHWGPYTSMGVTCSTGEAGSGSPVPAVCAPVTCPGTVNGVSVCLPCSQSSEPPSVSSTNTGSVSSGNAPAGSVPGTVTTSSGTTCTSTDCTTTTTVTTVGSGGTQTTQTNTSTQPIGSFCNANPGSSLCASERDEPSSWGGSCAGFSCGGDAVQCAIAREQHVRNCALFDQATDLSRVGTAAATGENPSDHPRSQAQSTTFVLSSMLDSSPLFGSSGGCPADVSFAYAGQTLVIPFSQSCDVLHMLGAMWMGICYLVAATIVFYRR